MDLFPKGPLVKVLWVAKVFFISEYSVNGEWDLNVSLSVCSMLSEEVFLCKASSPTKRDWVNSKVIV